MVSLLEDETLKFWDRLIVGAKVMIDGVERDYPIHPSSYIEGNTLKKFVYLNTESGHVTHAYIHDQHGRRIREKTINIKKDDTGWMVTFFLSIEIKEGVTNG
ncbi:hypothetical protein H7992_21635 [Sporosarcina sp. resist]|uniref:hypothetical protein n=1 Tax=Sporosarcina sp. resist TaxID=2762563 RepID=UPI00164DEFA9|nr:hypothetical protein [Sporosarcina sp. resist]QNK87738.1 hypothetical protein H7992_21635 [Sporosarcina sp. resist]